MKMKPLIFVMAMAITALVSCTEEEQPPTVSYVFTDVSVDVGQTSATITCRNESVDDDKVHASVLLSKNENITDATKYPLKLKNDTLKSTINGLERNTMYYFCFEVYTANEHKRTEEVHHFQTTGNGDVTVITLDAVNVTQTTATGGGSITTDDNHTVSLRGICWDTVPNPNALQSPHLVGGEGMGTFLVNITGLISGTTYYMRAYALCNNVTYYGNQVSFRTSSSQAATVTTGEVTNITRTTALGSGEVTDDGGAEVTQRGVCWSTSHNPTTSDSHASSGTGTGSFTVNMTGLTANTTYYVRAYAKNSQGTNYGAEVSFTTTQDITTPTVTTSQVTNITQTTATGGGNVTSDGGVSVTARGICWSTSHNPTVSGSHTTDGTGTGSFTSSMTNLMPNTTYYVRAYATNSAGTAYGTEVSFITLSSGGGNAPTGAINGLFSVSTTQQVYFSQGNLQYIGSASTPYWKFADYQWEYLGNTGQGSTNQNVDRDLFGWGTSGYNHGAVCYQPWSRSTSDSDYYAYGNANYNLYNQTGQADWGYNPISNGGNQTNQWRTLTRDEWVYVFNTRTTASGIRYAKARVSNVNGVILLPDDWNPSYYSLSNTNANNASFNSNTITTTQWSTLEQHGAVFLPAAGFRYGTTVYDVGSYGGYWSASYRNSNYAYNAGFVAGNLNPQDDERRRYYGQSVRLVAPFEN